MWQNKKQCAEKCSMACIQSWNSEVQCFALHRAFHIKLYSGWSQYGRKALLVGSQVAEASLLEVSIWLIIVLSRICRLLTLNDDLINYEWSFIVCIVVNALQLDKHCCHLGVRGEIALLCFSRYQLKDWNVGILL